MRESSIFLINSCDRDSTVYSTSDFKVNTHTIHDVIGFELLDAQLALGQSSIHSSNNSLLLYIGSETRHIEIESGQYSPDTLVTALQSQLVGTGLVASLSPNKIITLTHPSTDFKIVTTIQNSIHRVLGMTSSKSLLESTNKSFTSPYPVDFTSGFEFIRIRFPDIDEYLQEDTPSHLQPGVGIYKLSSDTEYVDRLSRFPPRVFAVPKKINSIRVRLENPDGTTYKSNTNLDNVFVVRIWKLLRPSGHRNNKS